jgi:hypothetical protein
VPFSEVLQLDLPDPFPVTEFEAYHRSARAMLERPSDQRREFNAASNLIGWRLRASIEHAQALTESWRAEGPRSFEALYVQERHLFEMFVCGVSSLEATCYSAFALLAGMDPTIAFDQRARKNQSTPKTLAAVAPDGPIKDAAQSLSASAEWRIWNGYRNTMAHRTSVPRLITGVGGGGDPPPPMVFEYMQTWSTERLEGNEDEVTLHISWLCRSSKALFVAGQAQATGA